MNIFTSLFDRFGGKKAMGDAYPGTWVALNGGGDNVTTANLLEANREWAYIAVDRIASSMAGIRFKVMRYVRNGDDREVFDGPLMKFLESPAQNFTGKDFIYLNTAYKELAGNAFWEKLPAGKYAPLIPTRIAPVMADGQLIAFRYSDGSKQRIILAKNVLHDRYPDPAKPWWGVGKLQKIARWVDTSAYVTEFLTRFFTNGATFGGFIETAEETEARIKLIKVGLQNDHVGIANSHKIGVLPKGSKFSKVTSSMAEMELGATDDRYRDKILAGFGVPKTLVGLTTEVNRASAEASEYIYAKYTIKPKADDFIEFLNNSVAPALDSSGLFYYAYEEFVPVNMEVALKEKEIALAKQPYMTVNEARAKDGLPPVEGGDVIRNAAGNELGTPAPAPAPAPAADPEEEAEPTKAAPPRARAGLKRERLIESIVNKAVAVVSSQHEDPDAVSHKAFVGRVDAYEQRTADKVKEFNNQQERELTLNLNRITKSVKKADLFDMDREVTVMVDMISPLLKGLFLEQAVQEYLDQRFPGEIDQSHARIATVIDQAARRLAKSYNRTTADLLLKTLNEGIGKGEALAELSARVRGVYDFSDAVRAKAVAHTETFYIANEGNREAYRQSGVVESMRWYTGEDEKVCEFCGPMNGVEVGVSDVFFPKGEEMVGSEGGKLMLDYRAIDVPPLHTNCRCFIRPERIDIG